MKQISRELTAMMLDFKYDKAIKCTPKSRMTGKELLEIGKEVTEISKGFNIAIRAKVKYGNLYLTKLFSPRFQGHFHLIFGNKNELYFTRYEMKMRIDGICGELSLKTYEVSDDLIEVIVPKNRIENFHIIKCSNKNCEKRGK